MTAKTFYIKRKPMKFRTTDYIINRIEEYARKYGVPKASIINALLKTALQAIDLTAWGKTEFIKNLYLEEREKGRINPILYKMFEESDSHT